MTCSSLALLFLVSTATTAADVATDGGVHSDRQRATPEPDAPTEAAFDPVVAAAQCGAGGLAWAACLTPALIPYCGWALFPFLLCLIAPAVGATTQVVVGDWMGTSRHSILWPAVAHATYQVVISAVYLGLNLILATTYFALTGGFAALLQGDLPSVPTFEGPGAIAGYGVVGVAAFHWLVLVGLTLAGPALATGVMSFTAEPKDPGDDDFRAPGLFEPNHARGATSPKRRSSSTMAAMAF